MKPPVRSSVNPSHAANDNLKDDLIRRIQAQMSKNPRSIFTDLLRQAVADGYKRLLAPSIENELRGELTGSWQLNPEFSLLAGADWSNFKAKVGSGLDTIDGQSSVDTRRCGISANA